MKVGTNPRQQHANPAQLVLIGLVILAGMGFGCLPAPHMELATKLEPAPSKGVWWVAIDEPAVNGPIVGVEQYISPSQTRQWLIDNRGVRFFDYDGKTVSNSSAPLSTVALDGDFDVVPSLVRSQFGHPQPSAWPGPRLPQEEVDQMQCSADLVALLSQHWADSQTMPPRSLAGHTISNAMEFAKFTISDLMKSGM